MKRFRFGEGGDVAGDIRDKYGFDGDLLGIYAGNTGAIVHKWHHYIPIYDRYFARYRGTPVKFLEIGVNNGGSLQMWRRYLGDDAVLFGIDINAACAQYDGQAGQVRIGSQDDPEFLARVVDEMGGIDVVLDDGSHQMPHVRASLAALFPRLAGTGTYMIEDLHTAYIARFGGGYGSKDNFFRFVRELADDMHHWYHRKPLRHPEIGGQVAGVHIHDSIVVIDKAPVHAPTHSRVGG
jgi:hypothetical protein